MGTMSCWRHFLVSAPCMIALALLVAGCSEGASDLGSGPLDKGDSETAFVSDMAEGAFQDATFDSSDDVDLTLSREGAQPALVVITARVGGEFFATAHSVTETDASLSLPGGASYDVEFYNLGPGAFVGQLKVNRVEISDDAGVAGPY